MTLSNFYIVAFFRSSLSRYLLAFEACTTQSDLISNRIMINSYCMVLKGFFYKKGLFKARVNIKTPTSVRNNET